MRHALPLLLLASCKLYVPPAPPDYGEDCTPSDTFYEDKARSTRDISWSLEIPTEPEAALAYCENLLTERGWQTVSKGGDPETQWGRFNTTLPSELPVVLLGSGYDSKPATSKALILCHEAVHTYQWERDTARVFAPTYILNEGTFAYEVPAHRVSLHLWNAMAGGVSEERLEQKARSYMDNLFTKYKLDNNLPACMKDTGVSILMEKI